MVFALRRFFDHRVYDLLELGVDKYRAIREFAAAAASVQAGNKVCLPSANPYCVDLLNIDCPVCILSRLYFFSMTSHLIPF